MSVHPFLALRAARDPPCKYQSIQRTLFLHQHPVGGAEHAAQAPAELAGAIVVNRVDESPRLPDVPRQIAMTLSSCRPGGWEQRATSHIMPTHHKWFGDLAVSDAVVRAMALIAAHGVRHSRT